jgi:NADPH2:quinone reductase
VSGSRAAGASPPFYPARPHSVRWKRPVRHDPCDAFQVNRARSIALMRPSSIAYANDPEIYHQGARDLLSALKDGLRLPIGAEYPIRDAARTHEDLEAGRTTGSVVLTV